MKLDDYVSDPGGVVNSKAFQTQRFEDFKITNPEIFLWGKMFFQLEI